MCKKEFSDIEKLADHLLEHQNCPYCAKSQFPEGYAKHIAGHERENERLN